MSEGTVPEEAEPTVVTITADTSRLTEALRDVEGALLFAFHPDLATPAKRAARFRRLRAWELADELSSGDESS